MIAKIPIWLLANSFLATVSLAQAQQQTKLFKIGELLFRNRPGLGSGRRSSGDNREAWLCRG